MSDTRGQTSSTRSQTNHQRWLTRSPQTARDSVETMGQKLVFAMGVQHAPHNAMTDADDVARFHDRCSDLMRALLEELADAPDRPRPFPVIEDALGWPHRRIASVLGGVSRLRLIEFDGRAPTASWTSATRRPAGGRCGWTAAKQRRSTRCGRLICVTDAKGCCARSPRASHRCCCRRNRRSNRHPGGSHLRSRRSFRWLSHRRYRPSGLSPAVRDMRHRRRSRC